MRVVSVVSLKGGVGKTTVTLGLAGAAMGRGLRTLLVDIDPQANASTVVDPAQVSFTINDVLADARAGILAEAVVASGWGEGLDVVASERALEHRAVPEGHGALRLRITMQGIQARYDLVLIDTPPALGELTRNALAASDQALVVTEPAMFALQGAQQALEAISVVRGYNLRLHTAGIVVNKVRTQSAEHRYRLAELALTYGELVLQPPIPDRAVVQQASGACLPLQSWHSAPAREVSHVYDTYLDHLLAVEETDNPLRMNADA